MKDDKSPDDSILKQKNSLYTSIKFEELNEKLNNHTKYQATKCLSGRLYLYESALENIDFSSVAFYKEYLGYSSSTFFDFTDFQKSYISCCAFYKITFGDCNFTNSYISRSKFASCGFGYSNFNTSIFDVEFLDCEFGHCNFDSKDIGNENCYDIRFYSCKFEGNSFKNSFLRDVSFDRPQGVDTEGRSITYSPCDLLETSFRNADLINAKMETATGLQAHALAGADLTNAKLPPDIAKFEERGHVADLSRHARTNFLAIVLACLFMWLTIGSTDDAALLLNTGSSPLPVINTPLPIASFFLVAPALLLALYIYLHLYMQRLWEGLSTLPAVFPDGRPLDRHVWPWLLTGMVYLSVPRLKPRRPPLWRLQMAAGLFTGWIMVPATILWFAGRYNALHQPVFSAWFLWLPFALAVGFGWHAWSLMRATLAGETEPQPTEAPGRRSWLCRRSTRSIGVGVGALAFVAGVYWAAVELPSATSHWLARRVSPWLSGHAILEDAVLSQRPANWFQLEPDAQRQLKGVSGADLEGRDLRNARAQHAFLARANLYRTDLRRANLENADLRETNLEGARLQDARLIGADLRGARLQGASVRGAIFWNADLSGADFAGTVGLTGHNLWKACGDATTKLPPTFRPLPPCP